MIMKIIKKIISHQIFNHKMISSLIHHFIDSIMIMLLDTIHQIDFYIKVLMEIVIIVFFEIIL